MGSLSLGAKTKPVVFWLGGWGGNKGVSAIWRREVGPEAPFLGWAGRCGTVSQPASAPCGRDSTSAVTQPSLALSGRLAIGLVHADRVPPDLPNAFTAHSRFLQADGEDWGLCHR
jgi:hypothetical protein